MAKIAINMITTEQGTGRKLQKTLTDINAEATSQQIKTFATALNGLTTNVYGETNRIEKLNVDTEESGGSDNVAITVEIDGNTLAFLCPLLINATQEFINTKVALFKDDEKVTNLDGLLDTEAGVISVDLQAEHEASGYDLFSLFVDKYGAYYLCEE